MISHSDFSLRKLIHFVLAVAITTIFSGFPEGDAASRNKRAVAVVIGNMDYKDRTPDVEYAHNDAKAMKAYIIDVLGYDEENVILILDATKAELESVFGNERSYEGKLWRYLDPKGRSDVTVFYSGHGVPGLKDKRGYILPVDADPEAPEINGYPLNALMANLNKLEAKSITVYLDACFSGESPKGMLIRSASGLNITPKMPSNSVSRMTVITASQGDQVASWDAKNKHGMFTQHLLQGLYGEADGSEYGNQDNQISVSEIKEYLDDNMTRSARRQFGRHQNAWFNTTDDNVLAAVGSSVRPTLSSYSTPARTKPKKETVRQAQPVKPVVRLQAKPQPVQPVQPAKAAYNNPDQEIIGRWKLNITTDSCPFIDVELVTNLTRGGLTSSDHPFQSFSGELGGVPGFRTIEGIFTDNQGMANFEMEYSDGYWSGDWVKKALHWTAGNDCYGKVKMTKY